MQYVKAGYAGDNFPRTVFPSMVGRPMLRADEDIGDLVLKVRDYGCMKITGVFIRVVFSPPLSLSSDHVCLGTLVENLAGCDGRRRSLCSPKSAAVVTTD